MLDPKVLAYCKDDVCDIRGFDRSELMKAEPGLFVMRAYPGPDSGNNIGTVHGGFLLGLVDIAGAGAVDTCGIETSTINVNANFLRPAQVDDEYLEVVGKIVRRGRTISVSEVTIYRPNETVVLTANVTVAMLGTEIPDLR